MGDPAKNRQRIQDAVAVARQADAIVLGDRHQRVDRRAKRGPTIISATSPICP